MRDGYCRNLSRSSMLLLSTIVLIDFFTILVTAESTAVVRTTTGPVQGEILSSVNSMKYASFKGIPYAKPPLGYLRFKPPVAIDPWTETLNATVEGDPCIQASLIFIGSAIGSEDCLFINVQTPVTDLAKTPTNLKPVMVWIYGGGFISGSGSYRLYRPDYLVEKGVVYVSLNYRVGALGFLNLNHKNATGNAALKDQVLALKWVKANIEKFGGNPNNVTIFGQSAGSVAVGLHILSDASIGLFQGAISMSGSPLNTWAFDDPAKLQLGAEQFGKNLGATSNDKETLLKTFYNATANELVMASSRISLSFSPFVPTIEDESIATDPFLTKCSIVKYHTGNFTKVPQMLGFTDRETVTFFSIGRPIIDIISNVLDTVNLYGLSLPEILSLVKDRFNSSTNLLYELGEKKVQLLINVTTELGFTSQIDLNQQILANKNNEQPIYYYHVSFHTNRSFHNLLTNSSLLGAGHVDDLAYLFYLPAANYSTDPMDPTRRTINRVSTMWTNFAKYGNPTPSWIHDDIVNITWPNSGPSGYSLDIGNELKVGLRPTSAFMKLIQKAMMPLLGHINGCKNPLISELPNLLKQPLKLAKSVLGS